MFNHLRTSNSFVSWKRLLVTLLLVCAFLVLVGARRRAVRSGPVPDSVALDAARSLMVTDVEILSAFSFERVMTQLAERGAVDGVTALSLFRQWFDTQNAAPGMTAGPHCNDVLVDGKPYFNGFPRRCPTPEGALAAVNPFTEQPEFIPIALVNRFDQAPADGAHCGEYRVIFAKRSGLTDSRQKLLVNFEAVLPNPHANEGLAGCRPIAALWAELSAIPSLDARRARLEQFFFHGVAGFAPVIDPAHFDAPYGRIRTTHFTTGANASFGPRFYEFRLDRRTMTMHPEVLENMVFAKLFDGSVDTPLAREFRDEFIQQVASLATPDINLYRMAIPQKFLMVESDPLPDEPVFGYDVHYDHGRTTPAGADFESRIRAELAKGGSTLTPAQVINRADTLSCSGCHQLASDIGGGMTFPRSISFMQHVTESQKLAGDGGPASRYAISPALRDVFLPHRLRSLQAFLKSGSAPLPSK